MASSFHSTPTCQVVYFRGEFHRFDFHSGEPVSKIINVYSERPVLLDFNFHEDASATLSLSYGTHEVDYPAMLLDSSIIFVNMCRYVDFDWNQYIETLHGLNLFDVLVLVTTNDAITDENMVNMVNRLGFERVARYTGINRENGRIIIGRRNELTIKSKLTSKSAEIEILPLNLNRPFN